MQKNFFLEGYGCSLNRADTEQAAAFLEANGFLQVQEPMQARFLIINTCAVKEPTENRMLSRIRRLFEISKKNKSKLVVFGCLPKINPKKIFGISKAISIAGPNLEELSRALGLKEERFSPLLLQKKSNALVSIIPIARGCLGNCAFCATKQARGNLKSYSISEIKKKFDAETKKSCEVWLTAQDCACYGLDIGTSLPKLLKELLKSRKKFCIRIGMMNPYHALLIMGDLLPLFRDKRLYRFFHVPLQSGSDAVLKKMDRPCSRKQFLQLIKKIRKKLPDTTISTDIIAGFPGETEKDFEKTISAVKAIKPDIINISRFGARPNTKAEKMPLQVHGRIKKQRSRALSELQKKIALKKKQALVGTFQKIFVSEKGRKGNFVGRTISYTPVVIEKNLLGKFVKTRICRAFPSFVFGKTF